ncbi:hypothetical protein [Legionella longbeachae]|uniref:Uncharacterized protein n=1 Tax=Legionella longbeachae serogroup 1 (strain NSW150) TaxID=661367 RepID=D3HJ67_LEGLN|nr:hypothetical protein [Legionella longbeachae]VEE02956.1 Uncharacterised protein [Legionella oakridgensis]HBD7398843.1 hypothetical protein [Legionella pneumophila]ARB90808.1 hypothetical protein A6J40_00750 [Legionella longbeachae]ARM32766.1 hypothetical protein B0B39_04195 [Legionella longbeachae]EEZ94444.1 hypothetical protein LLB_3352 [Legionella longbeachae D-4968]
MQRKVELTYNFLSKLPADQDYDHKIFSPAFKSILLNLQNIYNIYGGIPKTCIRLLNQLKLPFDDREYLQKVSNPIRFFAVRDQNESFFTLAQSLENLRTLLSQDEHKLKDMFAKDIELMPGDDKSKTFARIVSEACTKAIDMTISELQAQMDCRFEEKPPSSPMMWVH